MNANNNNTKTLFVNLMKKRFVWLLVVAIFTLIVIPTGFALANNTENNNETSNVDTITISGNVSAYYEFGEFTPIASVVG